MDIGALLRNIIAHPKSSIQRMGILGGVLSIWFQPDYATEIIAAIATLWGATKMVGKDKDKA